MNEEIANAIALCDNLNLVEMYCRTALFEGIESLHQKMKGSLKASIEKIKLSEDHERLQVLELALAEWDHPKMIPYLRSKFNFDTLLETLDNSESEP